jgi:4-amino-4-deoxy-L-arabinose transferase-like glycosyltransferase
MLLCAVLFLPGIAALPPVDRDEARYAQATRRMLESGDFVDIRFQDEPRYKKPIGIHWLQAAAAALLDRADATAIWPLRIPSLVGAVIAVLLTGWVGEQLFSPRAGLLGGVFLASSLLLNVQARLATTDAALLACVVAAQTAVARAYRPGPVPPERWALLSWGALGAGLLIKGPIAPIVCGGTLLCLVAAERRLAWLRHLWSRNGVALMLLITVPWLAAIAYTTRGAFFAQSVGHDWLGKVLVGQEGHGALPGYHLLAFPLAFWPFSVFAWLALPWVWENRRRPEIRFCVAWILPAWALFELVATKLPHYVLPTYPAIAMLTGAALAEGGTARTVESRPRFARILVWVWLIVSGALALAVAAGPAVLEVKPKGSAIALGAALAVAVWAASARLRSGRHVAATAMLVVVAVVFHPLLFGYVLPGTESLWVSRRVADLVQRSRPCRDSTVAAVGYHEPSLVFLLGTKTKLVGTPLAAAHLLSDPACALALVPAVETATLSGILAHSGAAAVALGSVTGIDYSNGKRVDLRLYRIAE